MNQETQIVPVQEITKELCEKELHRLFNALEESTGDTATTVQIIKTISDGIEADPESAKVVFTPENIANVMQLKRKIDAGTFKVVDLEKAFPALTNLPFWAMLKTFLPK